MRHTFRRCLICIIPQWLWLLKRQTAGANKRRYQQAQIVISKFLHFTVRVAHIHSHGHKFKNKSSHALEDTCNSITCRYTGKGCAQVNTQSPSLPLCHTRAHTLILWWVKSFAVAVPEEESGSVCPKWLAYLCRKTDSFICLTLSRCFVVVSDLIWICKQVNAVSLPLSLAID